MLSRRPDGKYEVARIDGCQVTGVHPGLNDGAFLVEKRLQTGFEMRRHARGALQDFTREEPAFARQLMGHVQLAPYVSEDFRQGIAILIERDEWIEPGLHQLIEKGNVDLFLAVEIV